MKLEKSTMKKKKKMIEELDAIYAYEKKIKKLKKTNL